MSQEAILAVALAGCAIGVFGGLMGTWATIHAAKGPNERRLAYRLAGFGLLYLSALMVGFLMIRQPYGLAIHLINFGVLLQIPRFNRWFQQARETDLAMLAEKPKDAWPIDELA